MLYLLMGPSGSGKTTTCKELEKRGFTIVPTYTTRKPRPVDDYTVCISEEKFLSLKENREFISTATYASKMGEVSYGIPRITMEKERAYVIVCAEEYYWDIVFHCDRINYPKVRIFLDVDDDTILAMSEKDQTRAEANIDVSDRLKRDREKHTFLRAHSDLIICNHKMEKTPEEITEKIIQLTRNLATQEEEEVL